MKESTKKFLQANRRNFQSKMKIFEYCPSDMKPGQAIREIKADLSGKLIHFKHQKVYVELQDLKMVEFKTGAGKKYWRAVPSWGTYIYLAPSALENCKEKVAKGDYMPWSEETKQKMIRVAKLPIIEVE